MNDSYYEILGVTKKATPTELKRAYRKKARVAHPDKGGSDAAMAEINRAYECLIDPARRLTYDETGTDQVKNPIESDVRALLCESFDSLLNNDVVRDCLEYVEKFIRAGMEKLDHDKENCKSAIKKLKKWRAKIRRKSGENLFWIRLDQRLQQGEGVLQVIDHRMSVHEAALKMLQDYEEDEEKLQIVIARWPATGSFTTTSWSVQ